MKDINQDIQETEQISSKLKEIHTYPCHYQSGKSQGKENLENFKGKVIYHI